MSDPRWYARLSRRARDAWDQAGHFGMCFALASALGAGAAWAFMHWREFFDQAPIERIDDTERDMRFGLFGALAGQLVFMTWACVLAMRAAR
ncbi:MAG: hypothetical protein SFY95_11375 [Planctomycetota bacterium]|nr:hypothetical protein [Planctomycetota bacterium]